VALRVWRATALLGQRRRLLRRALSRGRAPHPGRLLSRDVLEAARAAPRMPSPRCPAAFTGALDRALWRDHSRDILPQLLHFGDAISMAHSVESRVPFLDHRLVELGFALPYTLKLRGNETKVVLRRAMAGRVPSAILGRRDKIGFNTPLRGWLQPHLPAIRALLEAPRRNGGSLFDAAGVQGVFAAFEAGERHSEAHLFRCLALELWYEQFIEGSAPPESASGC
jgi:asparagine synthase (glutamine-hydrolysing)